MNPGTIELLIKWGPLALIGIIFLVCFLVGLIRGSYKVMRRLVYVVLYVVLIWIFIDNITGFVLDFNGPAACGRPWRSAPDPRGSGGPPARCPAPWTGRTCSSAGH